MTRLESFQVLYNDRYLTPELVTARSFGKWFRNIFSESVCRRYLYVGSKKRGSEYHPGTKIGSYFDSHEFKNSTLNSWYIPQYSEAFEFLAKNNMTTLLDISWTRKDECTIGRLRCFTREQIELFLEEVIKECAIECNHFALTTRRRQVVVTYMDSNSYVCANTSRIPLFQNGYTKENVGTPMTLSEVEKVVGHKILLVSEEGENS